MQTKALLPLAACAIINFFGEILSTVVQKLLGGNCSFVHILYNFSWAIQRYIDRLDRIRRNNL